jgi:hypothetical protein
MQKNTFTFVFRITVAHTVAYFFAGIFAVVFMNYKEHYSSDSLGLLMLPVDSPMLALGPGLNIFRGIIRVCFSFGNSNRECCIKHFGIWKFSAQFTRWGIYQGIAFMGGFVQPYCLVGYLGVYRRINLSGICIASNSGNNWSKMGSSVDSRFLLGIAA